MYGPRHEVVIYEARVAPGCDPIMEIVCLEHLAEASINLDSTVYVPPLEEAFVDEDMARRLAIPEDFLLKVNRNRLASKRIRGAPYTRPKLCATLER